MLYQRQVFEVVEPRPFYAAMVQMCQQVVLSVPKSQTVGAIYLVRVIRHPRVEEMAIPAATHAFDVATGKETMVEAGMAAGAVSAA